MSEAARRRVPWWAVGIAIVLTGALAFETGRRWPIERLTSLLSRTSQAQAPAPWVPFAPMAFPRYEQGATVVGRRVFVFGGFMNRQNEATNRVDILDLDSGSWSSGSPMPEPLTHFNTVLRGDTIWVAGGFVGNHPGVPTAAVRGYVVSEDRWIVGPSLPAPRGSGVLVGHGDTLHFVGGWAEDRNTDRGEHWMLGPGDTAWLARAPLPEPRGHATAIFAEGALWIFGGTQGHDPMPVDVPHVHRYDPAEDRWEESPPLPYAASHQEAAIAMWRGMAVLAGGRSRPIAREQLDVILGYDLQTGRTRPLGRLPKPLLGTVAFILGDTIFAGFGDWSGNRPTPDPMVKAVLPATWHRGEDLPVALAEVAAGVVGDRLFVVGSRSRHTLAWNVVSGRWDPVGTWLARPNPGDHHGAEVWNGELVLVGGFGWESEGQVQIFDPRRNLWRAGPALPEKLGSVATALIDGRLYAAGGIANHTTRSTAWVLDALSGSWRAIAPMPRPRNHAAAATDGERLFVFGGRGPGSGDHNVVANGFDDVQIYDPRTDRWIVSDGSPGAPAPLPSARGGTGKAVWLDGEFWVMGGETLDDPEANRDGTYDRVDIYDPVTNRWRAGPPLGVARHGHFPVVLDGRILVPGGGTVAAASSSAVLELISPR